MPSIAQTRSGEVIDAELIPISVWNELKATGLPGDFLMTCCNTPAVLKTSVRGLHFFAHLHDECTTAPETAWHEEGKAAVLEAMTKLGFDCSEEASGGAAGDEWRADTLTVHGGRNIVIELQRSYQTVEEYIARQERYARYGVQCFWLTRRANLSAITKVTGRMRMRREWGGKFPPGRRSFFPLITEFPLSVLDLGASPKVWHVGNTECSIEQWLAAIVEGRYVYADGTWITKE